MTRKKTLKKKSKDTTVYALIYCRVSSTHQKIKGSGLDSQEHLCRTYAADNSYEV